MYAARIVTGTKRHTSHGALYHETGWATLTLRRQSHKLTHFFKIFHDLTPAYLKDIIPQTVAGRQNARYPLRNNANISQILCNMPSFKSSFYPSAIQLWNSLPMAVRTNRSLAAFKLYTRQQLSYKIPPYFCHLPRPSAIILSQMRVGF